MAFGVCPCLVPCRWCNARVVTFRPMMTEGFDSQIFISDYTYFTKSSRLSTVYVNEQFKGYRFHKNYRINWLSTKHTSWSVSFNICLDLVPCFVECFGSILPQLFLNIAGNWVRVFGNLSGLKSCKFAVQCVTCWHLEYGTPWRIKRFSLQCLINQIKHVKVQPMMLYLVANWSALSFSHQRYLMNNTDMHSDRTWQWLNYI